MNLNELVDLSSYPLLQPDTLKETLFLFQKQLSDRGLAVLPGFLKPEVTQLCRDLAVGSKSDYFKKTVYGNAYLTELDPNLDVSHVLNRVDSTTLGILASDQIAPENPLKTLYQQSEFLELVRMLTGKPKVYRYACPLGDINMALMEPGDYLRWHFDLSDFVVSIPLQLPEAGGTYEYIRNLRSEGDPNYEGVGRVLDGHTKDVQILDAAPGSLVIFEGRHTLHRVTQVEGNQDRYVALFGFADREGVTSSEYLRKARYGRVG